MKTSKTVKINPMSYASTMYCPGIVHSSLPFELYFWFEIINYTISVELKHLSISVYWHFRMEGWLFHWWRSSPVPPLPAHTCYSMHEWPCNWKWSKLCSSVVIKSDFAEGRGDSLILNDNLQGNAFEPERLCRGILASLSLNIWYSLASLPLMCATLSIYESLSNESSMMLFARD